MIFYDEMGRGSIEMLPRRGEGELGEEEEEEEAEDG